MERLAKRCQVIGGWVLLCNLVIFFLLSNTGRYQENYETFYWTQSDYLDSLFQGSLPHGAEQAFAITPIQVAFIICLMLLPIACTLFAGIYGIVGGSGQIVSGILTYLITVLYVISAVCIPCLWPEATGGQRYERGGGCFLPIFFSFISGILFTVGFVAASKVKTERAMAIPKVREMKQEQMEARYRMVSDTPVGRDPSPVLPPYQPGTVRGVLVGLAGIYAGAEIPMADGETIHFGRFSNNDLVFENQPKVSRNHCQLRWDAMQQKFSFRDYSSNGSFANGSDECLPQNIDLWMDAGTVIAIGDNTNLFRLE